MGITRQEAEKHLEYLARRRERYAARKKRDAPTPRKAPGKPAPARKPEQLALFPQPEVVGVLTERQLDEIAHEWVRFREGKRAGAVQRTPREWIEWVRTTVFDGKGD